jgi:hypothetical protein
LVQKLIMIEISGMTAFFSRVLPLSSKFFIAISLSAMIVTHVSTARAQVLINEFSCREDEEWVELYNSSELEISLDGWILQDQAQSPEPLSGMIGAKGYYVYSRRRGWLNNNGPDSISLYDSVAKSTLRDQVSYGPGELIEECPAVGNTASRQPDGSNNWIQSNPSKETANLLPPATATPLPTNTPIPSPTPSILPSSNPTLSKPTLTLSPTSRTVLGSTIAEPIASPSSEETPEAEGSDLLTENGPGSANLIPSLFIGSGLVIMGICGILAVRDFRKTNL